VSETKNAIVLHNGTSSTAIDSVALLVALIKPKDSYIKFEENSAPYRGGQELWIKKILEEEVKEDNTINETDII
jgi:hypothetical protein